MQKFHKNLLLTGLVIVGFISVINPTQAANISVNTLSSNSVVGQCNLSDAVLAHETSSAVQGCTAGTNGGPNTINLTIPGTYVTSSALNIRKPNLTITSPDTNQYKIDGGSNHQIFNINTNGIVTFNNLTLQNGSAASGGAIFTQSPIVITNSKFINNKSATVGGAIYAVETASSATSLSVTMDNVEAHKNSASNFGGFLSVDWTSGPVISVTLDNITAHENSAEENSALDFFRSQVILRNVTLSRNTATYLGAIGSLESTLSIANSTIHDNKKGELNLQNSTLNIKNNIFSRNTGSCMNIYSTTINSLGSNLSSDNNCSPYLTNASDRNNQGELYLAPLGYGTSLIPTNALLKNSPAINTGDNNGCTSTDARGIVRPQNSTCDIGAYELNKTPATALFRFFNVRNGEHFFTIDTTEANFLRTDPGMTAQWEDEGVAYPIDETSNGSNVAIYRLLQASTGYHHFTKDLNEVAALSALPDWTNEGIKFYASPTSQPGSSPVYRFFNKVNGQHLFTISFGEAYFLQTSTYGQQNWNYEDIEYYVFQN